METLKPVRTSPSIGFFIYLPDESDSLSPRPDLIDNSTLYGKKKGEREYIYHFYS